MNKPIMLISKFKIHDGKQAAFAALYDEALAAVRNQEPDTISFELYQNGRNRHPENFFKQPEATPLLQ